MCQFSLSQSKALHPPTQSIASANAKHCIRQRKALHPPTQSFATANAKLCNRQRKALQSPTQSFAIANAKLLVFWLNEISFGIHLCIEGQRAKGEVLREKGIFALRLLSSQAITPLSP